MKTTPIHFFKEEVKFRLSFRLNLQKWIWKMVKKEGFKISNLNFIFCHDKYLREINIKYLKHDYFTDIITFDNSVSEKIIEGDVFISIDRVHKNAKTFNASFEDELHRVMAHGVLHLLGYTDKTEKEKEKMRKMEDLWLKNFS